MTYKIRKRERCERSPKAGLRQAWIEYQVVEGHKILSRHETLHQAEAAERALLEKRWDDIAKITQHLTEGS